MTKQDKKSMHYKQKNHAKQSFWELKRFKIIDEFNLKQKKKSNKSDDAHVQIQLIFIVGTYY